jgi:hypothetical protein
VLPEPTVLPESPTLPIARRRQWVLSNLDRPTQDGFREGDVFRKEDGVPGVIVARRITDAEYLALVLESAAKLKLLSDSQPPDSAPLRLVV